MSSVVAENLPDAHGHFGQFGGRYVPETLMNPLQELEEEYFRAQHDPEFQRELNYYLKEFCGRPTPLYFAERLTKELGGAKIYLNRKDAENFAQRRFTSDLGTRRLLVLFAQFAERAIADEFFVLLVP